MKNRANRGPKKSAIRQQQKKIGKRWGQMRKKTPLSNGERKKKA